MEVLSATFNSDCSRLAIGFRAGFAVFQLSPFMLLFRSDYGGCNVVEALDNTSLVVVAGSDDSPTNPSRRIQSWHIGAAHQRVISQSMFHTPVLNIKINTTVLAVVRETLIHVYNPQKGLEKEIATISTESNPRGACALTASSDGNSLIAFPPKTGKGTIEIYDVHTLTSRRVLQDLHKGAIRLIQFSPDGSLVATASESGTWIRVSAVDPADARYWHLRRGWTQASIDSLSFSSDQSMICCSSDHGTLHVWYLRPEDSSASLTVSAAAQASSNMLSLLPVEDRMRAATFNVANEGRRCYASFSADNSRIYCVTDTGKLDVVQIIAATKTGKLEKTRELLTYDSKKDGRISSDSEDDTVADG